MAENRYKITTATKTFFTDYLKNDLIKKDNDAFFVRETPSDKWERLEKLEKHTSASEWFDDNGLAWTTVITFVLVAILFVSIFYQKYGNREAGLFILGIYICMPICILPAMLIHTILKHIPYSYYSVLSVSKLEKLIAQNKPYIPSYSSSNHKYSRGYRTGGSYGGGGSSGGGSSGYSASSTYVSSTDMDNALKSMQAKGFDWKTLANDKTDEEREKLFIEHFGNAGKGKIASDRFNRTDIYPARKDHLNKLINEGEFEDNSIKTDLLDKVKSFDDAISKDEFESVIHEIVGFKEQKKRIDNHVKYEGRLKNHEIKAIKEHLGYVCMACGLNPIEEYGENMKGIMEAHHKQPYAEIEEGESRTVEPDDFLILCPTCHRLIHKLDSPNDLDGLKELVNKPTRLSWWD